MSAAPKVVFPAVSSPVTAAERALHREELLRQLEQMYAYFGPERA